MIDQKAELESVELDAATRAYFTDYYRDQLGLPDWRDHVEARLDEGNTFAKRVLDWIETWINFSFAGKRVLVVGGGTGAETFGAHARGANVTTVEPDSNAIKILAAKARSTFRIANPAARAVCESLPYRSDRFDLVICYTVLEHTQDPVQCIDEMIRVVNPKGWIFLVTPDYRHLYEPHYKMMMPTFAPRWILRLWLKARGRPSEFIDSLQFVNTRVLMNIFQERPVTAFQVVHSWPGSWLSNPGRRKRLIKWMIRRLGFQLNQFWLIQKLEQPR